MGGLEKETINMLQESQIKLYVRELGLKLKVVRPLKKFFGRFLITRNLKKEEIQMIAIIARNVLE